MNSDIDHQTKKEMACCHDSKVEDFFKIATVLPVIYLYDLRCLTYCRTIMHSHVICRYWLARDNLRWTWKTLEKLQSLEVASRSAFCYGDISKSHSDAVTERSMILVPWKIHDKIEPPRLSSSSHPHDHKYSIHSHSFLKPFFGVALIGLIKVSRCL